MWEYHEQEEDVVDTSMRGRKQSVALQEFLRKKRDKQKQEQALERRQEVTQLDLNIDWETETD